MKPIDEADYKALLDRMEVLIDRLYNKRRIYRRKRRKRYHKLLLQQLKFLRVQLE
ncbi:MAG: hypothetical protein AAF518_15335 [Spirochaetota bacterium]